MHAFTRMVHAAGFSILGVACGAPKEAPKDAPGAGDTAAPAITDAPASSDAAPQVSCTKKGCSDEFTVRLHQRPSDPKGWSVTLDLDGKPATCTFDWSAATTAATCTGDVTMEFHEPPLEDRTSASVVIGSAPTKIGFTVSHNGKPVEEQRFYEPKYDTVQPNGPACTPTCRQAMGSFVLK